MAEALFERLTRAARDKGIFRPTDLARMANLSPVTVSAYMRGTRGASLEACFAMAQVLGVDPFWLFEGKEGGSTKVNQNLIKSAKAKVSAVAPPNMGGHHQVSSAFSRRQIPLYSCALAGPDGSVTIGPQMLDTIDAPAPIADVQDAYAVRVVGDSMEPRYEASEIVYCHPRMSVKKGDYVVAQISDKDGGGEIQGYIKRFVSADDAYLILEQLNPPKKLKFPRDRVRSVHKIVLAG